MNWLDKAHSNFDKKLVSIFKNGTIRAIFKKFWIRPNTLTLFRIVLVLPVTWLYHEHRLEMSGMLFFMAALLDAFDGPLARATGAESKIGAVLDPLADKLLFLFTLYLFYSHVWAWLFWSLLIIEVGLILIRGIIALVYYLQKREQPAMKANIFGKIKYLLEVISVLIIFLHLIYYSFLIIVANIILCLALFLSLLSVLKQAQKLFIRGS